jgi:hypothetical protein
VERGVDVAFLSKQQPPNPQQPAGEKKPAAAAPAQAEAKPKPKPVKPKTPSPWPWGKFVRIVASLAIAFHLTAVFTAPWYIQLWPTIVPMVEPGGVPRDEYGRELTLEQMRQMRYPEQIPVLPRILNKTLRHYANLLFINHGYDFFSPDPGVSHLIKYEVFNDAGEKLASGQFPHRGEQWPRLFYHRHMMLVEQLFDPAGGDANVRESLYRIADRLMVANDGTQARLQLIRHHLLTPQQVLAGQRIDSQGTYEQLESIEHRRQRSPEITPGGGP